MAVARPISTSSSLNAIQHQPTPKLTVVSTRQKGKPFTMKRALWLSACLMGGFFMVQTLHLQAAIVAQHYTNQALMVEIKQLEAQQKALHQHESELLKLSQLEAALTDEALSQDPARMVTLEKVPH